MYATTLLPLFVRKRCSVIPHPSSVHVENTVYFFFNKITEAKTKMNGYCTACRRQVLQRKKNKEKQAEDINVLLIFPPKKVFMLVYMFGFFKKIKKLSYTQKAEHQQD